MAEPDWLELAWKLSGSGMSKTRFAEVYADKIDKVPAGSHSAKAAVAALAPASDQTNAEVSDERLREIIERLARSFAVAYVDGRHGYTMEFAPSPAAHRDEYDEAESYSRIVLETEFRMDKPMAADLNRRSVTSQASEGAVADLAKTALLHANFLETHEGRNKDHRAIADDLRKIAGILAPVSKRVERLETALQQIKARTYSDDRGCALAADAVAEISDIASQALGGRA